VRAGFVTCHDLGTLGIMWRTASRDGIAVFEDAFAAGLKEEKILRTTAHELGHALNLYHDDGDDRCSGLDTGTTIMNQTGDLDANSGYVWSAAERAHFDSHPGPSVERSTRSGGSPVNGPIRRSAATPPTCWAPPSARASRTSRSGGSARPTGR
jgi:hypothetical protein